MKPKSIFATLFSIFLIVILLSIGISAIYSITTFNNFIFKIESDELMEKTEILSSLFPIHDIHNKDIVDNFTKSGINRITRITIIDSNGYVISDSMEDSTTMDNHLFREEIQYNINGFSEVVSRFSDTIKIRMIYYSLPLVDNEKIIGFIRTSIPLNLLEKRVFVVKITIIIISLVLVLLSVALCYIMAMKFSVSINSIKRVAGCYAIGDFNNRLPETGAKEIVSLSKSINSMGLFLQERISTISRQKNRYKLMLESMVEPVLRLDNNLIIEEINKSAELLFNSIGSEVIGLKITEITQNKELLEFINRGLKSTKSLEEIVSLRKVRESHQKVHLSVLRDVNDNRIGLLIVMNDLTEEVRLEEMRKEFVANVSHELRTPATAIQGYIETLLNNDVNKEQANRFLSIVHSHSTRLNSIIDDLLMLAGLEKNNSSFVFEKFPIGDLLSSVINIVNGKAEKALIDINISSQETHYIYAHPLLAEQAITNILSNAIKYSPKGSTINLRTKQQSGGLLIEVQDEGCGIPQEDQEQIFERFFRVDRARSRDQGGTGLGLSIVKRVMNIHGGTATLESVVDKGSIFRLFFPGRK